MTLSEMAAEEFHHDDDDEDEDDDKAKNEYLWQKGLCQKVFNKGYDLKHDVMNSFLRFDKQEQLLMETTRFTLVGKRQAAVNKADADLAAEQAAINQGEGTAEVKAKKAEKAEAKCARAKDNAFYLPCTSPANCRVEWSVDNLTDFKFLKSSNKRKSVGG